MLKKALFIILSGMTTALDRVKNVTSKISEVLEREKQQKKKRVNDVNRCHTQNADETTQKVKF